MKLKSLYDALIKAREAKDAIANQIIQLHDEGKTEEAITLEPKLVEAKKAVKDLDGQYYEMADAASDSGDAGRRFVPAGNVEPGESAETKDLRASSNYRNLWIESLRHGVTPQSIQNGQHSAEKYAPLMDAISETGGTPAGSEGGFLNPVDFDNMIIERMRQFKDLSDFVNVEEVTAYSGWRVIETATASEPFETLTELEVLEDEDETESPTFKKIDYTVVDKGGFLRVANSQLSDTPVQIMRYLSRWFGKKAVLTNNAAIKAILEAITPIPVADADNLLDAIKSALNKTLDPDISASASIVTNQTGFDLLDQLKDENLRPLLQPDPTNATVFRFKGRPVIMLADRLWANMDGGDNAPFAIGSGQEGITLFRRQPFEMASTSIGGSSWRSNSTEVRGIMRLDCKEADDEAIALLTVAIPSSS